MIRAGSIADIVNILSLLHWKGLFLTSPIYCKWSQYFYRVRGGKRKETCSSDSLIVFKRDKTKDLMHYVHVVLCVVKQYNYTRLIYFSVGKTNSCLLH